MKLKMKLEKKLKIQQAFMLIAVLISTTMASTGAVAQQTKAVDSVDTGNFYTGDASLVVVGRYAGLPALPSADAVVIDDFAVPSGAVKLDESLAARLHRHHLERHGQDEDSTPAVLARHVQAAFSASVIKELEKLHIQSSLEMKGPVSGQDTKLVIDGEFVAIDEGDETGRIFVGFGHGASDLKAHVTISSLSAGRATVILDCNLDSESSKKPGALIGSASSLISGSAGKALGDKKSKVEADAARMGKLIAQQVASLMAGHATAGAP